MKIGILTSSRADIGILTPLIKQLCVDVFFKCELIDFGFKKTTYIGTNIKIRRVKVNYHSDSKEDIAKNYGETVIKFASFWKSNKYDLILCLGDRYEMAASVQASIPFGYKIAHIHAGETSFGSTDNIYRDQISLLSHMFFTSHLTYKKRLSKLLYNRCDNIYSVGALGLSEIEKFSPKSKSTFLAHNKLPQNLDYLLFSIHPETINPENNFKYIEVLEKVLIKLQNNYSIIITSTNNDTYGSHYNQMFIELNNLFPSKIFFVENFGQENYYNALFYSDLFIGNSSSGIIEAASFNKFFINIGDRQKGRLTSDNVINVKFEESLIIKIIYRFYKKKFKGKNVYFKKNCINNIVEKIKLIK